MGLCGWGESQLWDFSVVPVSINRILSASLTGKPPSDVCMSYQIARFFLTSPPERLSMSSRNSWQTSLTVSSRFIFAILLLASTAFAQEIKRPSAEGDGGTAVKCGFFGTSLASAGMSLAYDAAGQSTSSALAVSGSINTTFYRSRTFSAWQTTGNTYSALTLSINSQETETSPSGSTGSGTLQYSTNGGSTWTTLISGNWARTTSTVTLSAGQDLSKLKIAACVQSTAGGDTRGPNENVTIFDIWTTGTTNAAGGGVGTSSGQPHRGIVIVN